MSAEAWFWGPYYNVSAQIAMPHYAPAHSKKKHRPFAAATGQTHHTRNQTVDRTDWTDFFR